MIGYGLVHPSQIKLIAQAVCKVLGGGEEVVRLLCETAAAETLCGQYADPTPNGAGRGLMQFDKIPFIDVRDRTRVNDVAAVRNAFGFDLRSVQYEQLSYSPLLSVIFARLFYKLKPGAIPLTLAGRSAYYKVHYNTRLGKSSEAKYMDCVRKCEVFL